MAPESVISLRIVRSVVSATTFQSNQCALKNHAGNDKKIRGLQLFKRWSTMGFPLMLHGFQHGKAFLHGRFAANNSGTQPGRVADLRTSALGVKRNSNTRG